MKSYADIKKGDIVQCYWKQTTVVSKPNYYWVKVTTEHADGSGHWLGIDLTGGLDALTLVNERRFVKFFDVEDLGEI